jgi:hypothetical protein
MVSLMPTSDTKAPPEPAPDLSQHAAHVLNVLACDHAPKDEPEWNQRNCNDDECHDKRATEQPVGADTWVEGGFFENGGVGHAADNR